MFIGNENYFSFLRLLSLWSVIVYWNLMTIHPSEWLLVQVVSGCLRGIPVLFFGDHLANSSWLSDEQTPRPRLRQSHGFDSHCCSGATLGLCALRNLIG
jgi:hypothetical protein